MHRLDLRQWKISESQSRARAIGLVQSRELQEVARVLHRRGNPWNSKIVCPILKGKRTGNGGDEGAAAHHRDRLIQNRESSLVYYTGEGMATSSILYYKVNEGEVNERGRVAGMMMEEKEKVYFGERTCFCKSKSPGQPILAALDFWTYKTGAFPN